jgi:hypothetical protein
VAEKAQYWSHEAARLILSAVRKQRERSANAYLAFSSFRTTADGLLLPTFRNVCHPQLNLSGSTLPGMPRGVFYLTLDPVKMPMWVNRHFMVL